LRRLYVSALVATLAFGGLLAVAIVVSLFQGRRVIREDVACFQERDARLTAEGERRYEAAEAQLADGGVSDEDFEWLLARRYFTKELDAGEPDPYPPEQNPDRIARIRFEEECHLRRASVTLGEPRSERAWLDQTPGQATMTIVAGFAPALVLWLLARWVRWLTRPE
jgi:hypothetical protein